VTIASGKRRQVVKDSIKNPCKSIIATDVPLSNTLKSHSLAASGRPALWTADALVTISVNINEYKTGGSS
jgi:hypothetical protein